MSCLYNPDPKLARMVDILRPLLEKASEDIGRAIVLSIPKPLPDVPKTEEIHDPAHDIICSLKEKVRVMDLANYAELSKVQHRCDVLGIVSLVTSELLNSGYRPLTKEMVVRVMDELFRKGSKYTFTQLTTAYNEICEGLNL